MSWTCWHARALPTPQCLSLGVSPNTADCVASTTFILGTEESQMRCPQIQCLVRAASWFADSCALAVCLWGGPGSLPAGGHQPIP